MMKIQFCDLCNESVPQADLEEGRAFVRKGRVVCASCDKAMSQPSPDSALGAPAQAVSPEATAAGTPPSTSSSNLALPAAPERSVAVRKSSAGLWVAVLAMAFTAAAIFVQNRGLEDAARENRNTRALGLRAQQEVLDNLRRVQAEFPRLLGEQEKRLTALLDANRNEINSKLLPWQGEQAKQSNDLRDELKKLAESRDTLVKHRLDDQRRLEDFSQRLAKSEDDARPLVERLQTLEQAAKAPPPPVPMLAGKNEPAWKPLLVDLTSANAGVRWEAVDGLGQARDPQAVPALLPMLKDPDVFVRMATARVLGDLKAASAVPGLLDALDDSEDAVREAAFVAMRSIVGNKDLKFDPLAPEAERAKRLKTLREWWKKEEESGVGRG